jgi:uncharacterized membrane protein
MGHPFIFLIAVILTVIPMWRILPRAGIAAPWALVSVIPLGALVLLWVLAFRRWPGDAPGQGV